MYKLTAFKPDGEKILDESFEAKDDLEAKEIGKTMLEEKNLLESTHRCTSSSGKLLLFHA
ncbi:YhzD family protein [Falsibacillus albus]